MCVVNKHIHNVYGVEKLCTNVSDMYICVCKCLYGVCLCMLVCLFVCTCVVCVYCTCMSVGVCVCVSVYVCVFMSMYVCMCCVYVHVHVYYIYAML